MDGTSHLKTHYLPHLIFIHGIFFWTIALIDLPLGEDTVINLQVFKTIYSNFLFFNEFPKWLPYTNQGITADFAYSFTFTPAFYVSTFIGKLLQYKDVLILFKLALYFEEIILLVGVYLITTQYSKNRITPVIAVITALLSCSWTYQIHWNFHLIYHLPLMLFFISRFFLGYGIIYLALTLLTMTLGGIFYPQIFVAFTLTLFVVFWLFIVRPPIRTILHLGSYPLITFFATLFSIIIAIMNLGFALNVTNGMQSLTPNRLADGSVSPDVFLVFAGYIFPQKFLELFYIQPLTVDFFSYAGLFSIFFVVLALRFETKKIFWVFIGTGICVALFSLGKFGLVAEFAYHTFPNMNKFRHVGYVTPVGKIFLIVASSFGIDYLLNNLTRKKIFRFSFLAIFILGGLFLLIDIANDFGYPYNPSADNTFVETADITVPFWFHYFHFTLLAIFLCCLGARQSGIFKRHIFEVITLILISVQMLSYKYLIETSNPTANSVRYNYQWEKNRDSYLATPMKYVAVRERDKLLADDDAMAVWKGGNTLGLNAMQRDLCFPIHRADLSSYSFDQLIKARFAISGESSFRYWRSNLVPEDEIFMRAIGCEVPKIYLATRSVSVSDAQEVFDLVESSTDLYFQPIAFQPNINRRVIAKRDNGQTDAIGVETVSVTEFSANRVTVDVLVPPQVENPLLVYLDSIHENWQVLVNGQEQSLIPVNIAFKGVELSSGANKVEFIFTGGSEWSQSSILLNYISSVGLFLLVGIFFIIKLSFRISHVGNSKK